MRGEGASHDVPRIHIGARGDERRHALHMPICRSGGERCVANLRGAAVGGQGMKCQGMKWYSRNCAHAPSRTGKYASVTFRVRILRVSVEPSAAAGVRSALHSAHRSQRLPR